MTIKTTLAFVTTLALAGCMPGDEAGDGRDDGFPTGKADGAIEEGSPEARAVLALVNDRTVDFGELDDDAALNKRAARNIIDHRDGADEEPATDDDNPFETLDELDKVPYVGVKALGSLLDYAREKGLLGGGVAAIMSPQPEDTSHNARIVDLINAAEVSIDVAIYSFSQAGISSALDAAANRGVAVRFIFETARAKDRKLDGSDLLNSKSGRLEKKGIDVRWVNKIMHHKFLIVDGPRDDLSSAATAQVASGSANWNAGGARFDENTLFYSGQAEMALRMQREFNLMWHNSRDIVAAGEVFDFDASELEITDEMIANVDDPNVDVWFTSENFKVSNTTFRIDVRNHVSSRLVEAIENADESIVVASGHLRSRPVAEALMAKAAADPSVAIRVYLDAQEYLSETSHHFQVEDLEECLAEASTDTQERNCLSSGFLFGFLIGDGTGIDVRYKYYSFRWDHSYANQMHHKYMVVDGDELYTGSYNYSDNAEHKSFENVHAFRGEANQVLIDQYLANFEVVWETQRDTDALDDLLGQVDSGESFPIVFDAIALEHEEIRNLKSEMASACPAINSTEFRQNASSHRFCDPAN